MSRTTCIVALLSLWTAATSVNAADASLQAAASAPAGSKLEIKWTGPGAPADFISVDAAGSPERTYGAYAYATSGNPVVVDLPDEPGDYAIRYHVAGSYAVVASIPLKITSVTATLKAAPTVAMGGQLTVTWTGPNNARDFISIDKTTDDERAYGPYAYASSGNPVTIVAPDIGGDYVIRYHTGGSYAVIGMTQVQVTESVATLKAPESAVAGAAIDVTWTGPGHKGDFVSIDPVGADDRAYGPYASPDGGAGNTVSVHAPDEAGDYVLRYHLASSYRVIGSTPLKITPATASVSAPAEVVAGKVFEVAWKGPDNETDFITVVEAGAPDKKYGGSNGYTRRGNPVRIEAPRTAGEYELRYLTGQSYTTLASAKLRVTPGTAPGHLKVVSDSPDAVGNYAAVEFLLDASGSMLQKIGGERRIELAKKALTDLTTNVLPANADFALRVFGNKEAGSCRTDLEIPLATLDKTSAVAHIKTINSMNLAKTPIGASLLLVRQDLAGVKGPALVVLVTDGEETCDGDPAAAITALRDAGLDVRVNIVGFAVDEVALKETFESWARLGKGGFFDAQDGAQLQRAIRATLRASYEVLASDKVVATGTVNGDPIELAPGDYQVRLIGDHPKDIGAAKIESGGAQELKF